MFGELGHIIQKFQKQNKKITNLFLRFRKTNDGIKLKSHYFLKGFIKILKYICIINICYI